MAQLPRLIIIQFLLYFVAGINHFINPGFYLKLMPTYIPRHDDLVLISGITEITLAFLLLSGSTRRFASLLIICMLIVFISVHIYYIQICSDDMMLLIIGWIRLIIIQPLLIYWAWKAGKLSNRNQQLT